MKCPDGGRLFERDFQVHFYECDANLRLSIFGVMRYLGEISLLQSEAVGAGFAYYAEHRVAWLLSKWDIRLHRLPVFGSTVTVRTQPRSFRNFSGNRAFEIVDETGEACIDAQSQWIFIDTGRGRPARVHAHIHDCYGVEESDSALPWEADPRSIARRDHQREFTVRQSDIDHNGHVNNIRYVEWALESIPMEFLSGRSLNRLLVHYRKETRYGTEVLSAVQLETAGNGLQAIHEILDRGTVVCRLESVWK